MNDTYKKDPSDYSRSACLVSRNNSSHILVILVFAVFALSGIACAQTTTTTTYGGGTVVHQTTTYGAPYYAGGYYSARPVYGPVSIRGQSRRVSRRTSRRVSRRR